VALVSVTKIYDATCRREAAAPTLRAGTRPPNSEGHKGPPYGDPTVGIFMHSGETRFMSTVVKGWITLVEGIARRLG